MLLVRSACFLSSLAAAAQAAGDDLVWCTTFPRRRQPIPSLSVPVQLAVNLRCGGGRCANEGGAQDVGCARVKAVAGMGTTSPPS